MISDMISMELVLESYLDHQPNIIERKMFRWNKHSSFALSMDLARNLLNVNDVDDEDENDVDADEHGMVVMVEL